MFTCKTKKEITIHFFLFVVSLLQYFDRTQHNLYTTVFEPALDKQLIFLFS